METSGTLSSFSLPEPLPAHPRLLASSQDWDRIRQLLKTDAVSARIFLSLERKAGLLLETPLLERKMTGRRLLYISRFALERISLLAMVARVGGREEFARRAIDEMLNIAGFSDWNPSHFLDVAEMCLALATGYDWLHEYLSEPERDLIAAALIEKGILPSFVEPEPGYVRRANNWCQVCHAGLCAAAIVIADRDPVLTEKTLRRAVENIPAAAETYAPDGAYPEGPMYWNYGTGFHVVLAAALERFTGSAQGVDAFPGFKESAEYVNQMTLPDGKHFYSYADCRATRHLMIPLFWFATRFRRPDWLNTDLAEIDHYLDLYDAEAFDDSNYRLLFLALLWRDPSVTGAPAGEPPLHWMGRGEVPVAVHRSSFGDPAALFVGFKGGSPKASHAHMDIGSFFLQSDGVPWALDLGMQDYDSLENVGVRLWDMSENGMRWNVFRLGPESHNILRFNGNGQSLKGNGQFVRFQKDGLAPHSVLDLSSLYEGQVRQVHRGVMFLENRAVLIQDEWTGSDNSVEVRWQMLTGAEIEIKGDRLELSQNGQSLSLQVLDGTRVKMEVVDTALLLQPFDAANPGVKRITLTLHTESGQTGKLRVLATPGSQRELVPPPFLSLAEWSGGLE